MLVDFGVLTDNTGRFTLVVLKGLTGEIVAQHRLTAGFYKNCPKVDELLQQSGKTYMTVSSSKFKLTTEQNLYHVELTFPFPHCDEAKK